MLYFYLFVHVCFCVCAYHVWRGAQGPEEGTGFPGAGVRGAGESPYMSTGIQILVPRRAASALNH